MPKGNSAPDSAHPLLLEDVPLRMAKVDLKKMEETSRQAFGRVLARCASLAGLSHKEAAGRLGTDPSQFARWVSGLENAPVWRFHQDTVLGPALIAASAESTNGVRVRMVIDVPLRKVDA